MASPLHNQRGLTLIELLIAIGLGALIVAALASLYINSSRSYREDDQYARMLENGRFAVRFIADDLQMADFWGYYMLSDDIDDADVNVCGVEPLHTNPGSGATAFGAVQLISASDFSGTDCATLPTSGTPAGGLLIRRAGGPPTEGGSSPTVENDRYYLQVKAELKEAEALEGSDVPGTLPAPDDLWEYRSVIYYFDSGSMCRQRLIYSDMSQSPPECLVDGISAARFLWGIDSEGDGQADLFTRTPTSAQLRGAVSVRICLLLESEGELRSYTNTNTYSLCDAAAVGPFNDGRLRRIFERNVELRNAANAILFRTF